MLILFPTTCFSMLKDYIKVIAVILVSAAISAYTYWLVNYSDMPNTQYFTELFGVVGTHTLLTIVCVATGMFAAILALGTYAHSVGYTQEDLERISDDAMQGRPPL